MASNRPFRDDGKDYYFGFDIYKAVYNVTNIVADICRSIEDLAEKNASVNWMMAIQKVITLKNMMCIHCRGPHHRC